MSRQSSSGSKIATHRTFWMRTLSAMGCHPARGWQPILARMDRVGRRQLRIYQRQLEAIGERAMHEIMRFLGLHAHLQAWVA